MTPLKVILFLLALAINQSEEIVASSIDSDDAAALGSEAMVTLYNDQLDFEKLLHTETVLIESLRDYIARVEKNIVIVKRKVLEIREINDRAMNNTDLYINNPINAFMILKRFNNDWRILHELANKTLSTEGFLERVKKTTAALQFPEEEDVDEAIGNLLRISDVYQLEPQLISTGELNGIKFGSEMSWSDCLEIGRKSDKNGDFKVAKYWIETAMNKLPATDSTSAASTATTTTTTQAASATNSSTNEFTSHTRPTSDHLTEEERKIEAEKARFEILQALLNIEFHMGNFQAAAKVTDEMLKLKPQHKGLRSAKETIIETLKKDMETLQRQDQQTSAEEQAKKKDKQKKSVEQLLVEEICRDSTTTSPLPSVGDGAANKLCYVQHANLPELLLQPAHIEVVNIDPFIAIHHDLLTYEQVLKLSSLIESSSGNEDEGDESDSDPVLELKFTGLGQQRLIGLNKKLQSLIGHSRHLIGEWRPRYHSFEDDASFGETTLMAESTTSQQSRIFANVLLSLHSAKLGGSVVFPQLELSIQLPARSLLYWANLNEYQEVDYRTKQYICPVIAGMQLVAFSTIQRA